MTLDKEIEKKSIKNNDQNDEVLTDGETVFHPKVWGGEYWIVNKEYCGKKMVLKKGYRCSIHHHKIKDETFLVISGKVLMEIEGEKKILYVGDKQYIPIGVKHRFTGLEDSEIVEFSTHHIENDSYRDTQSGKVPDDEFQKLLMEDWDKDISINNFKGMKALVLGDLMLDVHEHGIVERVMPDAPAPIVKITDTDYFLGGAGNVISNIKSLGGDVTFVGVKGNDENARRIEGLLSSNDVDFKLYEIDLPTIAKINLIAKRANAESQKLLRIDIEKEIKLSENQEDEIIAYIKGHISKFNVAVISDYNKGVCTENICKALIREAKKNNVPVVVDPKGKNWGKYEGATIAKPNVEELGVALGQYVENTNESVSIAGRRLFLSSGLDYLLVSRSDEGVMLFSKNESTPFSLLPSTDKIINVCGVGDTMVAALALGIASKMNIRTAVKVSNIAAGCACSKQGTTAVDFNELNYKMCLKEDNSKIVDISVIDSLVEFLRKDGKKIIFTNGYFDAINNSHIEHFKQAKALGDILIVGVNSDLSAESNHVNLKNNEIARLSFLSNISIIDYLVTFDCDKPSNLLEKIYPDVIVKGGNYTEDQIVGREFAKEARILPYI